MVFSSLLDDIGGGSMSRSAERMEGTAVGMALVLVLVLVMDKQIVAACRNR